MTYQVKSKEFVLKHYTEFIPCRLRDEDIIKSNKKIEYINKPFVFDCEVTSWINPVGIKRACVYIWTCICFDNDVYYGRTWDDFVRFIEMIKAGYNLSKSKRAICYVHNLSYDSHFFMPWFEITECFAIDTHAPLSFCAAGCIEFKCSLRLSGVSLDKIGKDIGVGKVKGFNYTLKRSPITTLTDEEYKYCMFDVIVLYFYISNQISENQGKITEIAKTFTGITRRESRKRCANDPVHKKMYWNCKIEQLEIMDGLEMAFQGGYTHANSANANQVLQYVHSYDLSSDYPSQMVKQKFPITGFRRVHLQKIMNPEKWATLMKIHITGINAKTHHSIISTSKIINQLDYRNTIIDNGRLVSYPDTITMWITEQDYLIYQMFYSWESEYIEIMYISRKGYLSEPYVLHVLELYQYKTTLKGETDPDKVLLYKLSKAMINSMYGMSVTNPMRTKWTYCRDDDLTVWEQEEKDRQTMLDDYNKSRSNFLSYQWGVWVTAYARADLLRTVKAISDRAEVFDADGRPYDDVVYCDTDSIKLLHGEKYADIFKAFDAEDERKMKAAMQSLDLDDDTYAPKDPKGRARPLGVFAYEPNEIDETLPYTYRYFKTLGAKRYIYSFVEDWEKPGAFGITIAGLPKTRNAKNLVYRAIKEDTTPFELFADGLRIAAEDTGKNTLTYVDSGFTETLTDYQGNTCTVTEKAYIHMSAAPFEMGIAEDFKRLMNKRKRRDYI